MENEDKSVDGDKGTDLSQDQINSMFEARLKRLEIYLQREDHDITKYD